MGVGSHATTYLRLFGLDLSLDQIRLPRTTFSLNLILDFFFIIISILFIINFVKKHKTKNEGERLLPCCLRGS
jgi:hypothetical protein